MKKYLTFLFLIVLISCDQVTSEYKTYEEAKAEQLFQKGWIPQDLINENISDIFLKDNLDLNTFIFSFKTEKEVLSRFTQDGKIKISEVSRIDIPKWFNEEIKDLKTYQYEDSDELILSLSFNESTGKLYGWGKFK